VTRPPHHLNNPLRGQIFWAVKSPLLVIAFLPPWNFMGLRWHFDHKNNLFVPPHLLCTQLLFALPHRTAYLTSFFLWFAILPTNRGVSGQATVKQNVLHKRKIKTVQKFNLYVYHFVLVSAVVKIIRNVNSNSVSFQDSIKMTAETSFS